MMEARNRETDDHDRSALMSRVEEAIRQTSGEDGGPSALARLSNARQRLYSAAIAFCEGHISEGQLRAMRELLREHEQQFIELGEINVPPFIQELELGDAPSKPMEDETEPDAAAAPEIATEIQEPPVASTPMSEPVSQALPEEDLDPSIQEKLDSLEIKIQRLEEDIQKGRINPAQYRALQRHFEEQRSIAVELHKKHPESERWRVVLDSGKTTFLMQVNEAICHGISCFEYETQRALFQEGRIPKESQAGTGFLGAFSGPMPEEQTKRMFGTQTEDGTTLLLIPGQYSAVLAAFSKEPPEWQARALREVHRNFEYINRSVFCDGVDRPLVLPDLSNFIRSQSTES
ncbi:MAG TPA: hypothetical protein G4O08_07885 [Anaerolineae bacterium]|nr:hypothetical protein [Anaerolineae bacterium]